MAGQGPLSGDAAPSQASDGSSSVGKGAAAAVRFLAKFQLELTILLLLALTYGAIRYADVILYKELVVSRDSGAPFFAATYDDRQEGTGHSEMTLDPNDPMSATCVLREGFFPNPFCGLEIVFADASGTRGIDLSSYHSLAVDLTHRGPSKSFRIFIKNYDDRYSTPHARHTSKFHTTEVFAPPGRVTKEIPLVRFPVAEWWVVREQEDPEATQPTMENVVSIDIDTATRPELGRHDFTIHSLTLKGTVIPLDRWYLIIIGCWVLLIAGFLAHRLIGHRRRAAQERHLHELETERLERAKVAAEKASNAKSQFLSSMSHELRTPLNAILGYAQLLERVQTSERHTAAARTIRDSGSHLLTLINDILDLSKIEAGKLTLKASRMDLHACIQGVGEMIRIRAADKDLDFDCAMAPDLPRFVTGDETRIRQVLINLLGNAVKFTSRGTVGLRVSTLARGETSARLRFEVEDSGVGIAGDDLRAIFKPFEQVGDAERKSAGTGLGLSISSQMVKLMGGRIEVDSMPGRGSRFWFDVDLPVEEDAGALLVIAPAEVRGYQGRRRTILIADDIEANRLLQAQELDELGFHTLEASDGAEAISAIQSGRPDLVLMDLKMPGVDGYEAIRRLRADPHSKDLPIIAVSAGMTAEAEAQALEAGATAFLAKPVERAQLIDVVGRLLSLEWSAAGEIPSDDDEDELMVPPQDKLLVLLHLARAGRMKAICGEAETLASLDEGYRPFAQKVQKLARNYQSIGLLRMIERHCEPQEAA